MVRSLSSVLCVAALLGGCASTPRKASAPPHPAAGPAVVGYALSLQGIPYRYGKESPGEGFDCSGFVKHVFQRYGLRLPRTVREMAQVLPPVDKRERRPGDLLFFDTGGGGLSHVGIYVGDESFVHAPSSHSGHVMVSSLDRPYWWQRFMAVRRPSTVGRLLSKR